MKEGDRVTGEPANWMRREQHPTVTGYFHTREFDFGGHTIKTDFVMVGEVPIDCENIRPANRREKDTVLK